MSKCIIDTNVPKFASKSDFATLLEAKCAFACLDFIEGFLKDQNSIIVLDSEQCIFHEYFVNCRPANQDNVASRFLLWVMRNLTLQTGCRAEFQHLHKNMNGEYIHYPDSEQLQGFDPSDKKFIALSLAHPNHPPVIQGSDSLWWRYKDPLHSHGVDVIFLCEQYVIEKQKCMRVL